MASSKSNIQTTDRSVKECISQLITTNFKDFRAPDSQQQVKEMMNWYMERIGMNPELKNLPPIIHVAGTKGKGSTCAFVESILRNLNLKTGLFTSPHLVDIRERFRIDGEPIAMDLFLDVFFNTFDRLKETENVVHEKKFRPLPGYFYFLTLLAYQLFTKEQVDVLILEVGIGGRLDSTNVVQSTVSGITLLDLDHTEILGNTIEAIAGEKAGILKESVPAFTVAQNILAHEVIQNRADSVKTNIEIVPPLGMSSPFQGTRQPPHKRLKPNDEAEQREIILPDLPAGVWLQDEVTQLGLAGEFQLSNAALAVAMCHSLLAQEDELRSKTQLETFKETESIEEKLDTMLSIPQVKTGLENCRWPGRAQTVILPNATKSKTGDIVFFMDGAHSPKSIGCCLEWFNCNKGNFVGKEKKTMQVLVFNCSHSRDVGSFIQDVYKSTKFDVVFFTHCSTRPSPVKRPSVSEIVEKLGISKPTEEHKFEDLHWQRTLSAVWEAMDNQGDGVPSKRFTTKSVADALACIKSMDVDNNTDVHVLVTGSLLLVGDVLEELQWRPSSDGLKVEIA